jgi:hypothetical protein
VLSRLFIQLQSALQSNYVQIPQTRGANETLIAPLHSF